MKLAQQQLPAADADAVADVVADHSWMLVAGCRLLQLQLLLPLLLLLMLPLLLQSLPQMFRLLLLLLLLHCCNSKCGRNCCSDPRAASKLCTRAASNAQVVPRRPALNQRWTTTPSNNKHQIKQHGAMWVLATNKNIAFVPQRATTQERQCSKVSAAITSNRDE